MKQETAALEKIERIQGVLVCCVCLILVLTLFSDYRFKKDAAFERLKLVAELTSPLLKVPLQQGLPDDVAKKANDLKNRYALARLDIVAIENTDPGGDRKDGDSTSAWPVSQASFRAAGWPFQPSYSYDILIQTDTRPLGLLSIGIEEKTSKIFLLTSFLLVVLGLYFLLLLRRRLRIGVKPHGIWESSAGSSAYGSPSSAAQDSADDRSLRQSQVHNILLRSEIEKMILEQGRLLEERDRAIASAKAKNDFLAQMSHEIRTLMNGIVGVLSLLQKSEQTEESVGFLDAAVRSADSLLLLINDLLDISKIEAGKIVFEKIDFDLRQIVDECVALYADAAMKKNINLHCYIPLDIRTHVLGDPTRLRQILTNLLSNAIKFTNEGGVTVQIEMVTVKHGEERLRFSIEDTGIGIVSEEIDNIFDMFTQANSSTARKYGGTGLGLNVCKNLVELQQGEIGVISTPGCGSIFWFILDFPTHSDIADVLPCQELGEKNVLIFDGCENCRTIISEYLQGCGVQTRIGSDARAIMPQLALLQQQGVFPDIILIEFSLLHEQIDSFIEDLHTHFDTRVPLIFLLANERGIFDKLKDRGIAGIILKPVRLEQLYLELTGKAHHQAKKHAPESGDLLFGMVLLVDDEPINQRVGEAILKKIGLKVEIAQSGREAIEKCEEKTYDLILMDIQMPEMSGLEATEIIRLREKEQGAPAKIIIALTANALPSIRDRCIEVGMDGYLAKPIKPDVVASYLRPWLGGQVVPSLHQAVSAEIQLIENKMHIPTHESQSPVWNRRLALEYVGGDEALLRDLMKLFLRRNDELLAAVVSAVERNDGRDISAAAHAYKGAVNHFAAAKAQKLAQRLEDTARLGQLGESNILLAKLENAASELIAALIEQVGELNGEEAGRYHG